MLEFVKAIQSEKCEVCKFEDRKRRRMFLKRQTNPENKIVIVRCMSVHAHPLRRTRSS